MRISLLTIFIIATLLLMPQEGWAYVGPGTGLSAIGSILAFLGTIVLIIIGFFWYPVKRLIKSIKKRTTQNKSGY
jgi:hypothetical protein